MEGILGKQLLKKYVIFHSQETLSQNRHEQQEYALHQYPPRGTDKEKEDEDHEKQDTDRRLFQ